MTDNTLDALQERIIEINGVMHNLGDTIAGLRARADAAEAQLAAMKPDAAWSINNPMQVWLIGVAAAYEVGLAFLVKAGVAGGVEGDPLTDLWNQLTPADARVALNRIRAEAMREVWPVVRKVICERDWTDADGDVFCDAIEQAILARAKEVDCDHPAQV